MVHLTVTSWARPDVWKLYLHLKKDRKIYKHSISKGVLQVKKQATSEVQINKIEISVSTCTLFKNLKVKSSKLKSISHNYRLTYFNYQIVWGGGIRHQIQRCKSFWKFITCSPLGASFKRQLIVYISMCIQTKRHSYRVHVGTSMCSYQVLSVESIQFNEIIRPL